MGGLKGELPLGTFDVSVEHAPTSERAIGVALCFLTFATALILIIVANVQREQWRGHQAWKFPVMYVLGAIWVLDVLSRIFSAARIFSVRASHLSDWFNPLALTLILGGFISFVSCVAAFYMKSSGTEEVDDEAPVTFDINNPGANPVPVEKLSVSSSINFAANGVVLAVSCVRLAWIATVGIWFGLNHYMYRSEQSTNEPTHERRARNPIKLTSFARAALNGELPIGALFDKKWRLGTGDVLGSLKDHNYQPQSSFMRIAEFVAVIIRTLSTIASIIGLTIVTT